MEIATMLKRYRYLHISGASGEVEATTAVQARELLNRRNGWTAKRGELVVVPA